MSDLSDSPATKQGAHHDWSELLEYDDDLKERLLSRLTWLGIPDFRHPSEQFSLDLVQKTLPRCTSLQTLSLRQNRAEVEFTNVHDYVCKLPLTVAQYAPKTVTTLELRLIFPCMDRLVDTLKAQRSSIKRLGIDFGAWVQRYSRQQRTSAKELNESTSSRAANTAAKTLRFEAYEEAHDDALGAEERWHLPESRFGQDASSGPDHNYAVDGRHGFEREFYGQAESKGQLLPELQPHRKGLGCLVSATKDHRHDVDNHLGEMHTHSLSALLNHLYTIGTMHKGLKFFALKPEWQEKSTDPVHPLALIEDPPILGEIKAYNDKLVALPALQPVVFTWINKTFDWRPIFDWDWFMDPCRGDVDGAYSILVQRWNEETPHSKPSIVDKLVAEVAKRFQVVKDAGIPIHLLVGRRHPDQSNLYWGWPRDEATWARWLKERFDVKLKPVAPLVSTLTVMYDLRSPLDEDRLQALDKLLPKNTTGLEESICPRPVCPWKAVDRSCPFPKDHQWPRSTPRNTYYQPQRMANKQKMSTDPPPPLKLAPNHPCLPATGHHTSGLDSEDDTLYVHTRNAAYMREAVGWQRFWAAYAPHLTNLQALNFRMPKVFDGTGSVKLANLLDPVLGWEMKAHADEAGPRKMVGLEESDELGFRPTRLVEKGEKIWDAGTFVRRTWVKLPPDDWNGKKKQEPEALTKGEEDIDDPFSDGEETNEIDAREKEELKKAMKRAEDAARLVADMEAELKTKQIPSSDPTEPASDLDRCLRSTYGRRILRMAKHTWQERVKQYMQELQDTYNGPTGHESAAVRHALMSTRSTLLIHLPLFRSEYIFRVDEGMKDGIGLVEHSRNYEDEERERRGLSDATAEGTTIAAPTTALDAKQGLEGEDDYDLFGSPPPSPFRRRRGSDMLTSCAMSSLNDINPAHVTPHVHSSDPTFALQQPAVQLPDVTPSFEDVLATLQTHGRSALAQPHCEEEDFYGTVEVRQTVEVEETHVAVAQAHTAYIHVEESITTTQVTEEVEQPQLGTLLVPGLPSVARAPEVEQLPERRPLSVILKQSKEPAPPSKKPMPSTSATQPKEQTSPKASIMPREKPTEPPVQAAQPNTPPQKTTLAHVEPVTLESTPAKKSFSTTKPTCKVVQASEYPAKEPATVFENPTTPKSTIKKPTRTKKPAPPRSPPSPSPDVMTSSPSSLASTPPHPPSPLSPPPIRKRVPHKRKDPVLADADSLIIDNERRSTRSRSGTPAKTYKEASDDEEDKAKTKRTRNGGVKGKKRAPDRDYAGKEAKKRKKKGE